MVQVLGAQYQVELSGIGDDALVLFDTRDMYWFSEDGTLLNGFEIYSSSLNNPEVYVHNEITTDEETSLVYNDLTFNINDTDFTSADTIASISMISDRFTLGSDARLGLHLNPIYTLTDNEQIKPVGDTVNATVLFCALTVDGETIEVPMYRNDLIVGGTYDLTARLHEFFEGRDIQYYWVVYEGENVVPSFVQDISIQATLPWTDVRVVDWDTDIVYPEYVSYDNFNLLEWISTAVDGFMRAPLFVLGDFSVTIGAVLAVGIAVPIFVAFLRRYAGG